MDGDAPRISDETLARALSELCTGAGTVLLHYGPDETLRWASQSLADTFGYAPAAVVGTRFRMDADDARAGNESLVRLAAGTGDHVVRLRSEVACHDGGRKWADLTVLFVASPAGARPEALVLCRDITAEVAAAGALREHQVSGRLLAHISDVVIVTTASGEISWVSPSVRTVLGWQPAELVGRPILHLLHEADARRLGEQAARDELLVPDPDIDAAALPGAVTAVTPPVAREAGATSFDADPGLVRVRTADGELRWMSVRGQRIAPQAGQPGYSVNVARDVHEQVLLRSQRSRDAELLRNAIAMTSIGVVIADLRGRAVTVNPAICTMLGVRAEQVLGQPLLDYVHPEDRDRILAQGRTFVARGTTGERDELRLLRSDGQTLWVRRLTTLVPDHEGRAQALLIQVEDVEAEREAQQQLTFLAFHDPLTGLRNRAWFADQLSVQLESAPRRGGAVGLLLLDLDDFKVINDSLGHSAGDQVLVSVARHLSERLRPSDLLGRLGGDEFAVIVTDASTVADLQHVAARIAGHLRDLDLIVERHRVRVSASIGVAIAAPDTTTTADELLREADAALYAAKAAGRGRWAVYDERMRAAAMARLTTEAEVRAGLHGHRFVPHYQPIVSLADRRVHRHEALVRWQQADGSFTAPASFLPVTEASGLIVPLGRQVLDAVLADLAGERVQAVSVNVSAVELAHRNWYRTVVALLDHHGVEPHRLVFELTETAALSLGPGVRDDLTRLRELSVGLHLDDFGTGYSSIAVLTELPVTGLKLDRRFTRELTGALTQADKLSAGLAKLVDGLGLAGIAEGIESEQQAAILARHGWQFGQGHLFGRPEPLTDSRVR